MCRLRQRLSIFWSSYLELAIGSLWREDLHYACLLEAVLLLSGRLLRKCISTSQTVATRALQALADFRERIKKYDSQYETITDRRQHYIKLTDMCATCLYHHSSQTFTL